MNRLATSLLRLLERFGVGVTRAEHVSTLEFLDGIPDDPAFLLYRCRPQPAMIRVPLPKGRGLPFFSFDSASQHPMVAALQRAGADEDLFLRVREMLHRYYQLVQPQTAAEVLGLSGLEHPALAEQPSWSATMPWEPWPPQQSAELVTRGVRRENRRGGLACGIEAGWAWAGPVSDEKLELETRRIVDVHHSIASGGYRRAAVQGSEMAVYVLRRGAGDWVWQCRTGQHRAAAAAACGIAELPVRVLRVVDRNHAHCWPQVQLGLLSEVAAVGVFDAVFAGAQPPCTSRWCQRLESGPSIKSAQPPARVVRSC